MIKPALPFALFVVACTSSTGADSKVMSALRAEQPHIDSVHFTTATSIAENPAPSVDVTVTGSPASAIYAATIALPEMPAAEINCPADFGITYTLEFSANGQQVVEAALEPTGCQEVSLSITQGTAWTATDAAYWSTLADNLGIAEAAIYPYEQADE